MYKDFIEFLWNEDFENGTTTLIKTNRSDTTMDVISDSEIVFEGEYCGKSYLTDERFFLELTTSQAFDLPQGGTRIFLEMNFKCNYSFTMGIFAISSTAEQFNIVNLNPSDEWKKIYIDLTNAVNVFPDAFSYSIFFGAVKGDGDEDYSIYLDNIKLMHK
jgi:hypothetical protein